MLTSLTPYLHLGATPAQSVNNLYEWLDNIASTLGGEACLVFDLTDVWEKGLYHHMRNNIHTLFEGEISKNLDWLVQCRETNISAGKYYAVQSGGMRSLLMGQKKIGPFLS